LLKSGSEVVSALDREASQAKRLCQPEEVRVPELYAE